MKHKFEEILKKRRSHYLLDNDILLCEESIIELVKLAVKYVPSAFNSQSTRLLLLLGDSHKHFWQAVCDRIRKIVAADVFKRSEDKIKRSFASAYGTILFYEDQETVKRMQSDFPLYARDFPAYSEHTSAMHQFAIWTMLSNVGLGASLQHYSNLVEDDCRWMFCVPREWRLVAQMPFGRPLDVPEEKSEKPIEERLRIFR